MPAKTASRAVSAKPRKLTPQRENFARHLAMGFSPPEAYRRCFTISPTTKSATISNNAYMLQRNSDVAARIRALVDEAAERAVVTRTGMLVEMQFNREMAVDTGKLSVAATSSRDRARILNFMTPERAPVHAPDEAAQHVQDGTTAEERSLFEIARRVFFTLELGKRRAKELPPPKAD